MHAESAMRDTPRVAFLIITDVFVVALLVMLLGGLLGGCGATPRRYPHGDYVMNIASAAHTVAAGTVSTASTG
jgi:hypothetical protein